MLKNKIKTLSELKRIKNKLKRKKFVFTNGCFDLLHFGHVKYLEEAKRKGDFLVVAVNSDSSVRKIKSKGRPITGEKDRLGVIAALESVDYVIKFNQSTPLEAIKNLKPDILVKGADWNQDSIVGADFVRSIGGRICRIKLLKGRSTTKIIKKIGKIRD
ncbi:MAG: D-glycero-beta-D-manno-heptose 1-phosphate adenylyltransferase [Candidatus Omnitrophica bacterium]|nr:D-glycero-beta-D-manno-heptose 1-phosphate adenylyltransferase [Candidatus Omnitrophota bacterium]MBU1905559.1 D-glycero-beta-D-manno-heptose 1-phosphate adenylyltransferase [Candidatus Omnitrophota bacterium]